MTRLSRHVILSALGIILGAFGLELAFVCLVGSLPTPFGSTGQIILRWLLLVLLLGLFTLVALRWRRRVLVRARVLVDSADHLRRQVSDSAEEATLLWTAVEQLPVSVVVTDPEGRIRYVNPAFSRITGYSPEEALGSTPRLLRSGVQDQAFYRELWGTITTGNAWRGEVINRRKDGTPYVQELVIQPVRDAGGRVAHFIGIGHDVTERRQAQDALQRSGDALRESTEALLASQRVARLGSYRADLVQGTWTCTAVLDDLFGLDDPAFQKTVSGWLSLVHPDDREDVAAYFTRTVVEGAGRFDREYRIVRPRDRQIRWVHGLGETVTDPTGHPVELLGTIQDITDRKQAELALSESEEQFRALSDQSLTGIALIQEGRFVYVNPRLAEIFGYDPADLLGRTTLEVVHEDDRPMMGESIRRRLSGEVQRVHHLFKGLRKDGSTVDLELFGRSLTYRGRPAAMSTLLDITERTQAESHRLAQERRFRSLIENSAEGIGLMAGDTSAIYLSPAFTRMLGYPVEDWLGRRLLELVHPDDLPQAASMLARGLEEPTVPVSWQFRFRDAAGDWRWMEGTAVNLTGDPAVEGIVVNWREITDRKKAEEALRQSEARQRALLHGIPDLIFVLDDSGVFVDYHPASRTESAMPPERFLGRQVREVLLAEEAERLEAALAEARRTGATQRVEYTIRSGPANHHYEARVVPMEADTFTVVARDITSEKTLEAQLRQAQKMEAVGQLTGGIAHDFNNILMAIVGYTDFLLAEIKASPALAEDVQEIRKAADRATVLTRQLLAFSRRQVLVPQLLDLNTLVRDMGKMLQRLIGEDVELRTHLADRLGTVRADPGQLEQVVMNLVLNARDAMPAGGTLNIGTADVELDQTYMESHPYVTPGPYVLVWVSDSGVGMTREVMNHLFEPFFTTKTQGKGTGLGLATVYGIVKQSGGHINVYSEPQVGSTFKIYLPRADEAPELVAAPAKQAPRGGRETILVADDDDSVRALVRRVLVEHGYTVIVAGSPLAAREAVRRSPTPIALLITDVVMPGQSGRELADELTGLLPGLKVLYMSGYTHDAIVHRGVLDPGIHFVSKPVSADVLLRTVRSVLDGPAADG